MESVHISAGAESVKRLQISGVRLAAMKEEVREGYCYVVQRLCKMKLIVTCCGGQQELKKDLRIADATQRRLVLDKVQSMMFPGSPKPVVAKSTAAEGEHKVPAAATGLKSPASTPSSTTS